jgi:hypothetical protein
LIARTTAKSPMLKRRGSDQVRPHEDVYSRG